MPDVTIASAAARTVFSSTLQANLFQLFHPMGGVCARPLGALLTTFWVVSPAQAFCATNCAANRHAATEIALPNKPRTRRCARPQNFISSPPSPLTVLAPRASLNRSLLEQII